jgi:tetratricopeptide (TPR) repeat protein
MYLNVLRPAVGIVADRFTFFASLGVAISIIALLIKKHPLQLPLSKSVLIISIIIITVFGSVTIARNTNWNSLNSLITADYNKYPNNSFLNYKQGVNLIREMQEPNAKFSPEQRNSRVREAKALLEKSVRIAPDYAQSRTYLAYVLIYLINDFKAAIPEVNLALQSKESTELYFYKGICMRETKQKDSAEFYLKKCLERDHTYFNAYNLLMFDYNAANEFQKSIDMYNNAIKNGVETVEIYNGLGKTYWQMKNNVEAKKYYQKALGINPSNEEAAAMVKRL